MKTFLLELDNRGNSGANTCIKILFGVLLWAKVFIRLKIGAIRPRIGTKLGEPW